MSPKRFQPILARLQNQRLTFTLLLLFGLVSGCTTLSQQQGADGLESEAYGIWTGQLPCTGCDALDARLVLWKDPDLFRFTETFRTSGTTPKTFTAFGQWHIERVGETPQLGRFVLTTADGRRTVYLERLPRGNLRLLDHNGEAQGDDDAYTLKRTRARKQSD